MSKAEILQEIDQLTGWGDWQNRMFFSDEVVAESSDCPVCGSAVKGEGIMKNPDGSELHYRAFAICTNDDCDYGIEF